MNKEFADLLDKVWNDSKNEIFIRLDLWANGSTIHDVINLRNYYKHSFVLYLWYCKSNKKILIDYYKICLLRAEAQAEAWMKEGSTKLKLPYPEWTQEMEDEELIN